MALPARPRRRELARDWTRAVRPTAYVPPSPAEIGLFLLAPVDVIADAVRAEPFTAVSVVGERLAEARFTGPETLRRTVDVLGRQRQHELRPSRAAGRVRPAGRGQMRAEQRVERV
ncbi:hypothetical protein ACQPZF_08340 [Actinosynnema sp. CS-041913]|uniref:hypothetical protein n=1 Tax=Actinosynnema sp. CS-041913 TaxID=3239917 RepID=UPI003D94B1E3